MAVKAVSMRVGALNKTSCTAVVLSKDSNLVKVYANGVFMRNISMSKLGDDRGSADDAGETWACYYGTVDLTGLEPFTQYEFTATQNGNTDTVKIKTAPANNKSKFALAISTCFSPMAGGYTSESSTAWDFLAHYIDNSSYDVLACLFLDDIVYADGWFGASLGYENADGKKFQHEQATSGDPIDCEYDYALRYAMWYGIHQPYFLTVNPSIDADRYSIYLNSNFQYCMENMAFMPQWGDHEFVNNLGWNLGLELDTVPNGYHQTLNGFDGYGLNIYNDVMAPLQGTSISGESYAADTNANHWYVDFGPLRYIVLDPTTNAVPDNPSGQITMYGTTQIEDVLNCVEDGNQWFTALGRPAGAGRTPTNYETQYNNVSGDYYAYKDENFVQSEYDRLYLDDSALPKSLMYNDKTNGSLGALVTFRGDWHQGSWLYYRAPATTGKAAESINEICLNTASDSVGATLYGHGEDTYWDADDIDFIGGISDTYPPQSHKADKATMTIIEVDGEAQTPMITIHQWSMSYSLNGPVEEDGHFAGADAPEYITDNVGNTWRRIARRRFPLNSGSNKGKAEGDEIPEIVGFADSGSE